MKNQYTNQGLNERSSRGPFNSRYEFVPQFSYMAPSENASPPNLTGLSRGNTGMNLGMQGGFAPASGHGYQPPPPIHVDLGFSNQAYPPQGYGMNNPQGYYPLQNQGVGNGPVGYNPPLYQGVGIAPAGYNNIPYQGGPTIPPGYIPPGYNNPNFK